MLFACPFSRRKTSFHMIGYSVDRCRSGRFISRVSGKVHGLGSASDTTSASHSRRDGRRRVCPPLIAINTSRFFGAKHQPFEICAVSTRPDPGESILTGVRSAHEHSTSVYETLVDCFGA